MITEVGGDRSKTGQNSWWAQDDPASVEALREDQRRHFHR